MLYRLRDFEGAVGTWNGQWSCVRTTPQSTTLAMQRVGRYTDAFNGSGTTLKPDDDQISAIEDKLLRGLAMSDGAKKIAEPACRKTMRTAVAAGIRPLPSRQRAPRRRFHLLDGLVSFTEYGDCLVAEPGDDLTLRINGPFASGLDDGEPIIWSFGRHGC